MSECLFCRIVSGEIPAKVVAQNESVMAFQDINPQAPVHLLIIPKGHVASVKDLTPAQAPWLGEMTLMAQDLAQKYELDEGFRLVINTGAYAGQTVFHLHMHLLGGRDFTWPPG